MAGAPRRVGLGAGSLVREQPSHACTGSTFLGLVAARSVEMWTVKPVHDFLASRRARITPERAGLPRYGEKRRVPGLRREEVASLAGVSFDYYARLERGNLATAASAT
jgi:hypothetical protein